MSWRSTSSSDSTDTLTTSGSLLSCGAVLRCTTSATLARMTNVVGITPLSYCGCAVMSAGVGARIA